MPFVLRKTKDESNPLLPDAWGVQQTVGRLVYWFYQGGRTYFLILFCRGGKYGCDGLNFVRYKGVPIPEFQAGHTGDEAYRNWRLHRGTVTKQIVVKDFTANNTTDIFTSNAHGYVANTPVRMRSLGGALPAGLTADTKYWVINPTTNTYQLSSTDPATTTTLATFTTDGSGILKVWKADAGFDDPEQGRPQFFPELNLTFSNICYIEGMIPAAQSADEEPTDFQFSLRCRRIADYDVNGTYLTNNFSANNARVFADILINELKRPLTRNHWSSWFNFKQSCDTTIWQRTAANGSVAGIGLTGRYYNGTEFETLVVTRTDNEVNFNWGSGSPAVGVNNTNFSARLEGQVKHEFSETYTYELQHDDGARLWVNNQLIIDQWGTSNFGTHTGQIAAQAGALVNIKIELQAGGAPSLLILKWSSASRSLQVVPQNRLYPSDSQVKRAEAHITATGIQGGALIEEVMKRAPGWHFQDVNGALKFLSPNRPIVHHFKYDPAAPDERWNIAAKTFEAQPRTSDERPNWRIHYFNALEEELLAEKWVEGDRPELREQQGGLPTDTSPARWGVMTRSLTQRCAEQEMKIFSDPDRDLTLRGQADSYQVSKGDRVLFSHISTGDTFAEPVECMVTGESFGAGAADEKSYGLLPLTFPIYSDEPVSIVGER